MRKLFAKLGNTFFERIACIQAGIPIMEADLLEKRVNRSEVGKEALVQVVGIPFDKYVSKVEDNGGDGLGHMLWGIFYRNMMMSTVSYPSMPNWRYNRASIN